MNREEIIKYLDKPFEQKGLYNFLKSCINLQKVHTDDLIQQKWEQDCFKGIDEWFKGVIQSLYYRPNHYALILINGDNFFRDLFPQKEMYIDCHANYTTRSEFMYDRLVLEIEFFKNTLNIVENDDFVVKDNNEPPGFKVGDSYFITDKRLASYCSITNIWPYPVRSHFIVLNIESINWVMYNSIDKHLLWIEIFNKFKSKS